MFGGSEAFGAAVSALTRLDGPEGAWVTARSLADVDGASEPWLHKLLNQLVHAGLVEAKRGQHGGFRLGRPAGEVSLAELAEAVEGPGWLPDCVLGVRICREQPTCPTRRFWAGARAWIDREFRQITVADVAVCRHDGCASRAGVCAGAGEGI